MKHLILSLSLVTLFFINVASAEIPKFEQVTDVISRGGRPSTRADIQWLARNGYKLIINVENTMSAVKQEQAWAKQVGIAEVSFPMTWLEAPTDQQIDGILKILADESRGPIYIHCTHGEDRTGLVIGLYRVLVQKWDAHKSYDEMIAMGFHTKFVELEKYFWQRADE